MDRHVCEHLRALEDELASQGVKVTFSGQPWSANCRYWVYVDAVLDGEAIRKRLNLGATVSVHSNDDERSGLEKGLVCDACHDAVIGLHPRVAKGRAVIS